MQKSLFEQLIYWHPVIKRLSYFSGFGNCENLNPFLVYVAMVHWQAAAATMKESYMMLRFGMVFDQRAYRTTPRIANGGLPKKRSYWNASPRLSQLSTVGKLPNADWPLPSDSALEAADKAATEIARQGVAEAAGDPDRRLEHLLRASDELRATFLTMEARLVEWIGLFLPELRFGKDRSALPKAVGDADSLSTLSNRLGVSLPDVGPSKSEWKSLREWGESTAVFRGKLDRLENAIRELSESHLPSLSIMLGPLLAARICV